MVGDHFLVRGYENGRHFATREKFNPTLFVNANKKTNYKTLNGDYVEAVKPGSVRDCREFIKKYDGVEGFKIYGNERFIYQYISEIELILANVEGVMSVPSVKLKNLCAGDGNYSPNKYNMDEATKGKIVYPSLDPCVFEVKFPNKDIKGRAL